MEHLKDVEVKVNCKKKVYIDGSSNAICCRQALFKDPYFLSEEQQKREIEKSKLAEERTQAILDYLSARQTTDIQGWHELKRQREKEMPKPEKVVEVREPREDSLKRAKDSIFDFVLNNDFEYFFTGTINPEKFDSKEPKELLKPLQDWLKNMVKRYDFHYIMIAERHKNGGIHFHGLFYASDSLRLVDSGTKLYRGYNRPVSNDKAFEMGLSDGRTVYNLASWSFGFSTAIKLVGNRINTAYYITKYITKDCKKIFGKFFWHSRNIDKPKMVYENVDFDSIDVIERNGFKYVFEMGSTNETK